MKRRWLRWVLSIALLIAGGVGIAAWSLRADARHLELNMSLADAVRHDDLPSILRLVAEGADPATPSRYVPRPENFLQALRRIVTRQPPPRRGDGETALFRAAAHGDLDLMHMLLRRGADPNLGNIYDGTPFRTALAQKYEAIERLFLEHGAKWNIPDRFTTTCLWDAVANERVWLVRKWLAEGANPNETECVHRSTVLMNAAACKNTRIVRMLLDAGARVNLRDRERETALLCAMREGAPVELIKLLVERGARTDWTDWDKKTALDCARERHNAKTIALLITATKWRPASP